MSRRTVRSLLTAAASVALVAACGGGGSSSTSAAGASTAAGASGSAGTAAAGGGVVRLSMWAWAPNIDKVVKLWNDTHPGIQVTVSNQAQGDALVTKLLTASKAGNPPDLAQAEYQALPTLVTAGAVADITKYVKDAQSKFPAGAWKLIQFGDADYAVPQDFGPMMLYYRTDLFKQYGLAVPTTWDQFASEAKTLHQKDPKRYLTTFSSGDPGWFSGLAEQAGAKWWDVQGDTWSVGVNDAATKKVADYWGGLVNSGVISGQPMYTPQWNKAMSDGTLLAWPSAIWGPGVLAGIAPQTKGKWAMAPLPQWNAGDSKAGFWGGSSTAVLAKSHHQAEAAQFAEWLNSDPTAVNALVRTSSLYPAATSGQSGSALSQPPDFIPNQPDFYAVAKKISDIASGFTWGPDVNVTYNAYKDAFGKAIQAKSSFSAALDGMQSTTVADMKKSGFKVAGS